MVRVQILHHPRHRLWRLESYWYPLVLLRRHLRDRDLAIEFLDDADHPRCGDADVLCLSSMVFDRRLRDPQREDQVFAALDQLRRRAGRLLWFDLEDCTGRSQFEVMPYVDGYLRKQVYRDLAEYRQVYYGDRSFTDYYHRRFGVVDTEFPLKPTTLLAPADEAKLGVAWSLALCDFRSREPRARLAYAVADRWEAACGQHRDHAMPWSPPAQPRPMGMLAVFNLNYPKKTVSFQRERATQLLAALNDPAVQMGRLAPAEYFAALRSTKLVLSLFGHGEICYREHEAFIAGAAVLMPDMSHLRTWPNLHLPHETYWPLDWSLEDLCDTYQQLRDDETTRLSLATAGQEHYRACWSAAGKERLADRIAGILLGQPVSDG